MGPPNEPLMSNWLMPGVCVKFGFNAWSSGVRLLPRDQLPASFMNAAPANVFPPAFGTKFITGPPMSLSPNPPPTVIATSRRHSIAGSGLDLLKSGQRVSVARQAIEDTMRRCVPRGNSHEPSVFRAS